MMYYYSTMYLSVIVCSFVLFFCSPTLGAECSVCKEQFTVGEELLKLPCSHLYHNDCVIPWLKLVGTVHTHLVNVAIQCIYTYSVPVLESCIVNHTIAILLFLSLSPHFLLSQHDTCPTCRYHLNTGKYEPDQETA